MLFFILSRYPIEQGSFSARDPALHGELRKPKFRKHGKFRPFNRISDLRLLLLPSASDHESFQVWALGWGRYSRAYCAMPSSSKNKNYCLPVHGILSIFLQHQISKSVVPLFFSLTLKIHVSTPHKNIRKTSVPVLCHLGDCYVITTLLLNICLLPLKRLMDYV